MGWNGSARLLLKHRRNVRRLLKSLCSCGDAGLLTRLCGGGWIDRAPLYGVLSSSSRVTSRPARLLSEACLSLRDRRAQCFEVGLGLLGGITSEKRLRALALSLRDRIVPVEDPLPAPGLESSNRGGSVQAG